MCNLRNAAAILFRFMFRLPHLIKVQPTEHRKILFRILFRIPHLIRVQLTEHCKNSVPLCVPSTAPYTAPLKDSEKVQ